MCKPTFTHTKAKAYIGEHNSLPVPLILLHISEHNFLTILNQKLRVHLIFVDVQPYLSQTSDLTPKAAFLIPWLF